MHDLLNLLVDLRDDAFSDEACAGARRTIEAAGFSLENAASGDDPFLAWIDQEFGGAWSSEAANGRNLIARSSPGTHAGFATFDARGLSYSWLRGAASHPGVGIFGPFGVAPALRGSALGPNLLRAALGALRAAGYSQALIPAVGDEHLVRYYSNNAGARVVERFDRAHWNAVRYRTVVLASGSGSNFQSVIDNVAAGQLPLDLALLVSNRPGAYALERARAAQIAAVTLPWDRKAQARERYDADLRELVRREEPDLVLLLGWMHVLNDAFVTLFPQMINIHPAFLPLDQRRDVVGFPDGAMTPAFRGAHAVRDALEWGSRWTGASSHRVTLDADRGPVLARRPMQIAPGENAERVLDRLHPLEHRTLTDGITRWVYER